MGRPNFYMIGDNPNVNLGIVDCTDDRKSPCEPEVAYNIVRIHSLIIYSDLVEYTNVGDTKTHLIWCFPVILKLKEETL